MDRFALFGKPFDVPTVSVVLSEALDPVWEVALVNGVTSCQ